MGNPVARSAAPLRPAPMLEVQVGAGTRAHLFRSSNGANAKAMALRDGDVAYDYVLCGASGALRLADGLEPCRTCGSVAERVAGTA